MKKVELLAPAGNYDSFLGAIHAGADAVYLGGNRFGARAYADNFTQDEVCSAIRYAHIYGRKVYLTVNTLIKEKEFAELYDYLQLFYQSGLDGVIIQDMGVFQAVGRWFPGLERHISTQTTVTGAYGAAYLKSLGAVRIVPARELSLDEIKEIKAKVDIEIETFVHGAVCYCYSGQCLFSSILGGRSGNRGRCAQPCRLPYEARFEAAVDEKRDRSNNGQEKYPLSLKDMCTIALIPELIEAGIDSFKIEGRMKSPEYVAGVTALYRKYIDKYYSGTKDVYGVSSQDMDVLRALYMRSGISEGYYHRHNGKDMITLENPSYAGHNDEVVQKIREKYVQADDRLPVGGSVKLYKNIPAEYSVAYKDLSVTVRGNMVETAQKQPLSKETVKKQLVKSGNTVFSFININVEMEPDVFLPVKALNDLRRMACEALEEKIIEANGFSYSERQEQISQNNDAETEYHTPDVRGIETEYRDNRKGNSLHVFVQTEEQLYAILKRNIRNIKRIYVSSDLLEDKEKTREFLKNHSEDTDIYLAMPYIIRRSDEDFLNQIRRLLNDEAFKGVLIRNHEELQWLKEISYPKDIVTDANMYMWNKEAFHVYDKDCGGRYVSHELNFHEISRLSQEVGGSTLSQIIYGRIPMMITANCIAKTMGGCRKQKGFCYLKDRYRKIFPVYLNCRHCYNIIYNTVPLSLHQNIKKTKQTGITSFRLDFTTETGDDVNKIVSFFEGIVFENGENKAELPFSEYTNGHFKRGVE